MNTNNTVFPNANPIPPQGTANTAGGNGESNITVPPGEDFNTNTMQGSLQQILSDNLGNFVVCDFVIGTQEMVKRQGILYFVGRSYIVLYEEIEMTYVICDIFSIKFVTFYLPGRRPRPTQRALGQ